MSAGAAPLLEAGVDADAVPDATSGCGCAGVADRVWPDAAVDNEAADGVGASDEAGRPAGVAAVAAGTGTGTGSVDGNAGVGFGVSTGAIAVVLGWACARCRVGVGVGGAATDTAAGDAIFTSWISTGANRGRRVTCSNGAAPRNSHQPSARCTTTTIPSARYRVAPWCDE